MFIQILLFIACIDGANHVQNLTYMIKSRDTFTNGINCLFLSQFYFECYSLLKDIKSIVNERIRKVE